MAQFYGPNAPALGLNLPEPLRPPNLIQVPAAARRFGHLDTVRPSDCGVQIRQRDAADCELTKTFYFIRRGIQRIPDIFNNLPVALRRYFPGPNTFVDSVFALFE